MKTLTMNNTIYIYVFKHLELKYKKIISMNSVREIEIEIEK